MNQKISFIIISLIMVSSSFSEEKEEIRTIEIDGTVYKINVTSLHISPYSDIVDSEENSDNQKMASEGETVKRRIPFSADLDILFGSQMIGGDHYTSIADPGSYLGFRINRPKALNLFGQQFSAAYEISFSNLSDGNSIDEFDKISFNSFSYVLGKSFENFPLNLDLILGISYVDAETSTNSGNHLMAGGGIGYGLPFDLSLVLRYQYLEGGENSYELYSLNLEYNKSFSF